MLFNNSSEPLQYGQRNTNLVWQLAPGVKAPFHWDDADGRFELCVRPAQGKWNWSGAFEASLALHMSHSLVLYTISHKKPLAETIQFANVLSMPLEVAKCQCLPSA